MGNARGQVKELLNRAGVEVMGYRWTFRSRRSRLLGNVDVLADVGANVGQYGKEVRSAGWAGHLISYEPLAGAFAALEATAAQDPSWTAVRTAVGSEPGELSLNVSEDSVFTSALAALDRGKAVFSGLDTMRTETAPVATLDSLLADHRDGLLGVKVDVQGFERDVLLGAPETLKSAVYWEMELTPVALYDGQMLMGEALELLSEAGLVLVAVENIFSDVHSGRSLQFNGIFLRD